MTATDQNLIDDSEDVDLLMEFREVYKEHWYTFLKDKGMYTSWVHTYEENTISPMATIINEKVKQ